MQYLPVGQEVPVITLKTKIILTVVAFFVIPLRIEDGSFLQRTYKNFQITFEGRGDGGEPLEYVKNIQISKGKKSIDLQVNSRNGYGFTANKIISPYRKFYVNSKRFQLQSGGLQSKTLQLQPKMDWRERGVVSEVENQRACGACYAYSVIANIESSYAIMHNLTAPIKLSVQQMVDCARYLNFGCNGGDTCELLTWLKKKKIKILPERFYPMKYSKDKCEMKDIIEREKAEQGDSFFVQIKDFQCAGFIGREYEILEHLSNGPLVALISGGVMKRFHNRRDVITPSDCKNYTTDHAIQIVGYDMSSATPHYIIRNSWGRGFGDEGYAKVAIGSNTCGIASQISRLKIRKAHFA